MKLPSAKNADRVLIGRLSENKCKHIAMCSYAFVIFVYLNAVEAVYILSWLVMVQGALPAECPKQGRGLGIEPKALRTITKDLSRNTKMGQVPARKSKKNTHMLQLWLL